MRHSCRAAVPECPTKIKPGPDEPFGAGSLSEEILTNPGEGGPLAGVRPELGVLQSCAAADRQAHL